MKDFYYMVNGSEFYDTTAFGKAWKEAKEMAKEEHCEIHRIVVDRKEIRYEFYAKGGCFLDEKHYDKNKTQIF